MDQQSGYPRGPTSHYQWPTIRRSTTIHRTAAQPCPGMATKGTDDVVTTLYLAFDHVSYVATIRRTGWFAGREQ